MINLSRHIEVLLLKHDCVVVPGFGGFVAQYVPARYVSEEQSLLPPHRTVSFNAQLTWDDGLLVQSCMQTADISYPEAVRLVRKAVEELKRRLTDDGTYGFDGIGVLSVCQSGLYEFIPAEAGVASPLLYALEPVTTRTPQIVTVQQTTNQPAVSVAHEDVVRDKDDDINIKQKKSYTLSLNRELCNYVAAAVVAIIFYFLWVTPIGTTTSQSETTIATMWPAPKKPHTPRKATPSPAPMPTSTEKATTKTENKATKDEATSKITIVLVSSVKKSNAEAYVKTLHEDGFVEAEVFVRPKMVRVIYGHYANEAEAYDTLRKLHKDKRFADAWVMETNH